MSSTTKGKLDRPSLADYEEERHRGAGMFAIIGGHELDLITGTLASGALVSVHLVSVATPRTETWRMEIYGTKGRLEATTGGMPQITPCDIERVSGRL